MEGDKTCKSEIKSDQHAKKVWDSKRIQTRTCEAKMVYQIWTSMKAYWKMYPLSGPKRARVCAEN